MVRALGSGLSLCPFPACPWKGMRDGGKWRWNLASAKSEPLEPRELRVFEDSGASSMRPWVPGPSPAVRRASGKKGG